MNGQCAIAGSPPSGAEHELDRVLGAGIGAQDLGGLGNIDEIAINLPTGPYLGATLRLFNPSTQLWSIYWMDSRNPGLDPPMTGRFSGGRGLFYGDDTLGARPIRVRFIWTVISSGACRWEQAFSADEGQSWETNWTMDFTRVMGAE